MIKKIALTLLLIVLITFAFNVFAQDRELEVKYPEVQGEQPEKTTTQIPDYVKYIFNFLIGIGGVIALAALIYAGFQWFTSAGSPEKIQNAKDQISAALLGLVILFGSYLILTTINPNLVVFNLKRLRPIISQLPRGVLVCKEAVDVDRAWQLENEFKFQNPSEEREKQIKEQLDVILNEIALKCYTVSGSGDIISYFDNKITNIYFIPTVEYDEKGDIASVTEYGVVVYEESNFKGKSIAYYKHVFTSPITGPAPDKEEVKLSDLQISSIKPFVAFVEPDPNWRVTLYQEYNFNAKLSGATEKSFDSGAGYRYVDLTQEFKNTAGNFTSPKSIKIEGDLLAILFTADGRSDTFFSGSDSNLEDNLNIVKQVDCTDYKKQTIIKQDCRLVGGFGQNLSYMPCCGEAAATELIIISAKPL